MKSALLVSIIFLLSTGGLQAENPKNLIRSRSPSHLIIHKGIYFLPYTDDTSARDDTTRQYQEFKFQFSLKKNLFPICEGEVFFGFSQVSHWQVYDKEGSAPFRESNYNPEVFIDFWRESDDSFHPGLRIGIEHESNGQPIETSRSWNRTYLQSAIPVGGYWLTLKIWDRWDEPVKADPNQAQGDDNPDIDHYMGNWELQFETPNIHHFEMTTLVRKKVESHAPTVRIDLDFLCSNGVCVIFDNLYIRFQFFRGYGESLIDYNRLVTRYGIGFAFK